MSFHPAPYFEDFKKGDVFKTFRRTITEADLSTFTHLALLKLPIFIDEQYAGARFGGRFCPGLLTISVTAGMLDDVFGNNVIAAAGLDEINFLMPVRPGDTVGCRIEITETREKSDGKRGLVASFVDVTNQHDESVLTYRINFILARRNPTQA